MLPYDKSLIIIPTYNESDNVSKMISKVFELYPEISVLIIDDGSPDGTANIVKEIQKKNPKVYLMERKGKLGLGTAYIAGFKWALEKNYEFAFEMDCDFSHDPNDIKTLLEGAQENDLAIGSRYIGGIRILNWPMKRLLLSYFASIYTQIITGMKIKDATGGFKCFRASTLRKLNLNEVFSNGYSFQIELNYRCYKKNLKLKEVPITFSERREGQSKMSKKIIWEAIWAVWKLKFFVRG
jgi:dolichol-phosphate mannosyltransferase